MTPHKHEPYAGLYEVSDVARLIRATARLPDVPYPVNNRHIIRWIRRGLALRSLARVPGRDLLISFEDLISMRVVALLRAAGITWKKIYAAEDWLREHTGATRPFATEVVWTASHEIFADREGALIAASMGGQYPFVELIQKYLLPVAGLTFDKRRIAASWSPDQDILLDPAIQFGEPCIRGTRIPTRAIWSMYEGGDPAEFIATIYGLEQQQVDEAIAWENRLATVR